MTIVAAPITFSSEIGAKHDSSGEVIIRSVEEKEHGEEASRIFSRIEFFNVDRKKRRIKVIIGSWRNYDLRPEWKVVLRSGEKAFLREMPIGLYQIHWEIYDR